MKLIQPQKTESAFDDMLPANKAGGLVGRINIRPKVALLSALLGGACFVSVGYAGEVVVGLPPVRVYVPSVRVVVPPPPVFYFGGGYDNGSEVREYRRRGYESRKRAHHYESHDRDHDGDKH